MRAPIRPGRDTRIDFFRGVALWSICIDHLIQSWLRAITLKNFAFCDNTEVFVLLSGLSVGMAYRKSIARRGVAATAGKALQRALVIYRTHLIMGLLFVAEAGWLIERLKPDSFAGLLNLKTFIEQPFGSLLDIVLLRYQPKFLDILPLYLALLVMLCPVLPLLRWPKTLFGLSLGLYAATRVFGWELPQWMGGWTLNPLAWQLMFLTGVLAAALLPRRARDYSRSWDALAVVFSLFAFFESHAKHLAGHVPANLLLPVAMEKHDLHPLRFLNIVALSWLAWRYVPGHLAWFQSRVARYFILLGQHPLPVFASSVIFSTLGWAILATHPGWLSQLLTQGLATLGIWVVAWISAASSKPQSPASAVEAQAETERLLVLA